MYANDAKLILKILFEIISGDKARLVLMAQALQSNYNRRVNDNQLCRETDCLEFYSF